MASAFVSITDLDGVVHRVNPDQVEQITENTTLSQTLVHLDNKFVITTSTARATVQAALEAGAAVEFDAGGAGVLAVANGGTGADNASDARTNLEVVGLPTFTTKGDIVVATGAGAVERLAVGSEGQVPVARAAATGGWAWESPTGAGRVSSRVLWQPTAATATNGNLVSTTPEADALAAASISYGALSTRTDRQGFTFTSTGRGGATATMSAWKANWTVPTTKRFVVRGTMGARSANIQPIIFFAYQDITHFFALYRNTTIATSTWARNNSTTAVLYSTVTPVIGLNDGFGGDFEIHVDFSAVSEGPLGTYNILAYGAGSENSARNSFSGHLGGAPHASWATGSELTFAFGCNEITTTPGSTEIWNLQILKHPLDE